MSGPTTRLEDKDYTHQCRQRLEQHSVVLQTVKYLTASPVLKCNDVNDEVNIECDASEMVL